MLLKPREVARGGQYSENKKQGSARYLHGWVGYQGGARQDAEW